MYANEYLYRVMVAKELSKNFYEPGNPRRSHRFVWLRYARVLLGIQFDTYLKYLQLDTSSWKWDERAEEIVSQLIESLREKKRTDSDLIERQTRIEDLGLNPVSEIEVRANKVYHFFTDGILYGIEDSLTAKVVGKDSEGLSVGPVSTIFGFLSAEMPLPGKYTLFREAAEDEMVTFVRAESAHLNVSLYPKQGKNKPS